MYYFTGRGKAQKDVELNIEDVINSRPKQDIKAASEIAEIEENKAQDEGTTLSEKQIIESENNDPENSIITFSQIENYLDMLEETDYIKYEATKEKMKFNKISKDFEKELYKDPDFIKKILRRKS